MGELDSAAAADQADAARDALQLSKLDELAAAVAQTVDLDALADKVADRLAAKLNLGFVPATPE